MKLLLDTHTLIWFLNGDSKNLSKTAREAIEDISNENYVSWASIWEISIKNSLGKLPLNRPFSEFMKQLDNNGLQILDNKFNHYELVNKLPFHHNDPFDRFIIAQSFSENMTIVGLDAEFSRYDVPLLW
jgi:PIN domain nuclease of toxin-antitoxin system